MNTESFEGQPASHRLNQSHVDALMEGFGDESALSALADVQYSKFLMTLASIMELAPKDSISEAINLLGAAQQHNEARYSEFLTYPHIAVWASVCLRRLLQISDEGSVEDHLWHLRCIAASAAFQCGLSKFSIEVPIREGGVFLPALGKALISNSSTSTSTSTAMLSLLDGRLQIRAGDTAVFIPEDPGADSAVWQAIRRVRVEEAGLVLDAVVDDVDPYRGLNGTAQLAKPTPRLGEIEFKEWRVRVEDAWHELAHDHHRYAVGIAAGVRVLVPLRAPNWRTGYYENGFGAVVLTLPETSVGIAKSLLEETQRMKLAALHYALPLHAASRDPICMAPWADLPVSFGGLLEGYYSLPAVIEFWNVRQRVGFDGEEKGEALFRVAELTAAFKEVGRRLSEEEDCTRLGIKLIERIRKTRVADELAIPQTIREAAKFYAIDFTIAWRLQNLRVHEDVIDELLDAWEAGGVWVSLSIGLDVEFQKPHVHGHIWRRKLRIAHFTYPHRFDELIESPTYLRLVEPEASTGDALIVDCRWDEAEAYYRTLLDANFEDREVWSALATIEVCRSGFRSSSLGRFPEVVFALCRALQQRNENAPDLYVVARWLETLELRTNHWSFA